MILYTNHSCPLCKVAKVKLAAAGINFSICTEQAIMIRKNIERLPVLETDDGKLLDFNDIIRYCQEVNSEH